MRTVSLVTIKHLRQQPDENRTSFAIRWEFKPEDCWIGVFWKRSKMTSADMLDIWICLLPTLPIHLWRFYNIKQF